MKVNKTALLILSIYSTITTASVGMKRPIYNFKASTYHNQSLNNSSLIKNLGQKEKLKIRLQKEFLNALATQRKKYEHAKGALLNTTPTTKDNSNWHHLDPIDNAIEGVSSNNFFENTSSKSLDEVIVAVIDSGVDVNHEDLQGSVWINSREIPNNGIDDDNNGHIDDIFGWNFIGSKKGMAIIKEDKTITNGYRLIQGDPNEQVEADTFEQTRALIRLKQKSNLDASEQKELELLKSTVLSHRKTHNLNYQKYKSVHDEYLKNLNFLNSLGSRKVDIKNIDKFEIDKTNKEQVMAKITLMDILDTHVSLENILKQIRFHRNYALYCYNPNRDVRKEIVKDNPDYPFDRNYGNNDVIGPNPNHGTHIAGIIAANRDNNIGAKGVAPNVKIMSLRVTPVGDERDKDVANAIFYAIENGAKIINISFGKEISPNKHLVDKALLYAQQKDVLIVHAAGNDFKNIDEVRNYPTSKLDDGTKLNNWIEIAASSMYLSSSFVASFSNYGQTTVDLFAPGVDIYSLISNNMYTSYSGTSMAAPIVSAIAAVLWGKFNKASAQDIKDAIIQGARFHNNLIVYKPRIGKIKLSKLSKYPAVVNLNSSIKYLEKKLKPSDQVH